MAVVNDVLRRAVARPEVTRRGLSVVADGADRFVAARHAERRTMCRRRTTSGLPVALKLPGDDAEASGR